MADGRIEEMKNSEDIFYPIKVIRNVQHGKPTKAKVCSFLEKLNKNIDMFLEDNFDKLVEKQLIEAKGEDEQRSFNL